MKPTFPDSNGHSPSQNGKGQGSIETITDWDTLATMAGFVPETPAGRSQNRGQAAVLEPDVEPTEGDLPLLDKADLDDERSPQATKTPLWSNPFTKGAFIVILMGLGVGLVYLFILSFGYQKAQQQLTITQEPTPSPPTPSVDPAQTEIARLKTISALGTQAQTFKQGAGKLNQTIAPPNTQKKASAPTHQTAAPVTSPSSPSPSPSYTPPLTTLPAPPSQTYTPLARPLTSPGPAVSQDIARPDLPPIDPQKAWTDALNTGSYGQMEQTPSETAVTSEPSKEPLPVQNSVQTISNDRQSHYDADVAALLSGIPRHSVTIVPGTTTAATLQTPVMWAQDLKGDQQPQRFGLQLTQPLYSGNKTVALPAGTQMVAKVDTISGSGMVQLSVVAVVTPTSQGNQLIEIPPGSILITGAGGNPLMAHNYNHDRDQIAGMDTQIALMGALGQVGRLLNQPTNATTMTSPYLSSTSVTNGQTNIVGGLLEGGFNALLNRVSDRQQREINEILKRPNIWFIPAGQPLQVFITSAFEVNL